MEYKITFQAVWDGDNLILPQELTPVLDGKNVTLEFFNEENK